VKRATHAAHLLRDYPNAVRVRAGSLRTRVPSRWAAGSARPVVLLPGVYETWHFLRVLGDALNAAGHPVHAVPALGDHPNQRVTSIYPRFDPNIPEGSRLEGATNVEIPVVGHFRILDEPATIAAVLSAVGA
jgi:pimeloyl-ACP methyl ester carboxylesterase